MLKLRDIMTRDVVAFAPETTLLDAIATLSERHISGAPVLAGRRLVGMLSATDILEFVANQPSVVTSFGEPDTGDRGILDSHTVGEAMSGGLVSALPPDAPVFAAAEVMRSAGIHRVLVADDSGVVGIVTSLDVTRALADRKVVGRTYVFPSKTRFD